ncbi:hypothetical protein QBC47DRAFT_377908 [Echria macrotheca]|uniref:Uncharacterized protein n=1 Tax=Echria macrotheca TaxID=438768 RepID=A0AAJ0BEQ0_9PEZI|nr:hypothetical protein QBC47DRAFT_377908 [Echria macrotheca]
MNFPAPPSFHDPLLYPSTSTAPAPPTPSSSAQSANRPQQHQQSQPSGPAAHGGAVQPGPGPLPQPQHLQLVMNGMNMNGANMPAGAVVGLPTPAGHQAELNYIYGMVEELSRQLAQNQRALEEVVSGVGRVRNRVGHEDVLAASADELRAQESNLDALVSLLSEALEKANFSRDANAALLSQYATVLASMLKQLHDYKAKHVADVAAWHRSYRAQLAEARAENSRLREQIWEVQEHAGRANELLRRFRARYDENEARWERRVDARAHRQELRFWKRLAMPHLADDDPYWSDDDDLIDVAEKQRQRDIAKNLADAAAAAAAAAAAGGVLTDLEGEQQQQQQQQEENMAPQGQGSRTGTMPFPMSMMGGVPMQRGDSGSIVPVPPPRPSSAASSTGSTGQ